MILNNIKYQIYYTKVKYKNNQKGEKIMDENSQGEELDNIVILNDEEGNEVKFEFLDVVELDEEEYVVLLPVAEEGEEEEGEVVILKIEDNDDEEAEEESYVSVEDEEVLNKVFEIFKERFKDDFDFVD